MKTILIFAFTFLPALLAVLPAFAQRGVGEDTGVARQQLSPEIVTVSGTIVDLRIEPCAATTGRSTVGAHIILQDSDRGELNVHLGPAADVDFVISEIHKGDVVSASVFRTDNLPANAFIARDLKVGEKAFILRDKNLRPVWAGSGRGSRGMGR